LGSNKIGKGDKAKGPMRLAIRKQNVESREQRAESREQRAESREPDEYAVVIAGPLQTCGTCGTCAQCISIS